MKPILPRQILINTRQSYHMFKKNQPRISIKLEINRDENFWNQPPRNIQIQRSTQLLKIFKTFKYVREIDLSNLILYSRTLYLSKMIYFAKRMANAQTIKLFDFKSPKDNIPEGISESWPKYIKRIKSLIYNVGKKQSFEQPFSPENFSLFSHLVIRYQPCIKDLSVRSALDIYYLFRHYGRSRKFPTTLEKLSVENAIFPHPLTPLPLNNLKHFESKFMFNRQEDLVISVLKSFPYLCPDLQSLSLQWPYSPSTQTTPELSNIKTLQHLQKLKFQLPSMPTHNLKDILRNFNDCSLKHLELILGIRDEDQFVPIGRLLERQRNLDTLKLSIDCEKRFHNLEEVKIALNIIDGILSLRNLSISITSKTRKGLFFSELHPAFNNIFTKPIQLESFQFFFQHLSISNREFLDLFKCLEALAFNLKKLRIDIGDCEPDNTENIIRFVKNLQNIRSLKLNGLIISSKVFLGEFAEGLSRLLYLRSLTLREISPKNWKPTSADGLKKILLKRGLEKFHCKIPSPKNNFDEESLRMIRRMNPSLVEAPEIPGFNNDDQNYTIGIW